MKKVVVQIIMDEKALGPMGPAEMAETFRAALEKQGQDAMVAAQVFDDEFGYPVVCYVP